MVGSVSSSREWREEPCNSICCLFGLQSREHPEVSYTPIPCSHSGCLTLILLSLPVLRLPSLALRDLVSSQRIIPGLHQQQAFGMERAQVPPGPFSTDTEVSKFKSPARSCLTFKEGKVSEAQAKPQPTVGSQEDPKVQHS